MTTTFQSRELVRDELVALFVANGSWEEVFGYFPGLDEIHGKTPVLIIRSRGTLQSMEGVFNNPSQYRFFISNWVLADSPSDSGVTSSASEDKVDELDKTVRQIIRDNTGATSNADLYQFEQSFSQVDDVIIGGLPYIVETRAIIAVLNKGSI